VKIIVYISNKKITDLKVGDSFKANQVIASNRDFFEKSSLYKDENFFMAGTLAKVACISTWATFEDGSLISESLADRLVSHVTMYKDVTVGPNTNIVNMKDVGDQVDVGDSLLTFEKSFEDDSINKVLDKLGSDFNQTISDLSKSVVKSKYKGEIVDIDVRYNVPLESLSPSLKKVIKKYNTKNEQKKEYLRKLVVDKMKIKDPNLLEFYTRNNLFKDYEKITTEKIQGKKTDGILIEFYIKTTDRVSIGDKITFSVAVKSIICEIVTNENAPFSEYRPEEKIEAIISPYSPINRMCLDYIDQLLTNKVLVELKNKIKELL